MTDEQLQQIVAALMLAGMLAGGQIKMGRDSNGRIVFTPSLDEARRIIREASRELSQDRLAG